MTEAEFHIWDIQMKLRLPVPWSTMDGRSGTAEPATGRTCGVFCRWNALPTGWNAMVSTLQDRLRQMRALELLSAYSKTKHNESVKDSSTFFIWENDNREVQ